MSSHAVGYDKQARWIGSRYRTGDTFNCKQAILVWTATAFDPGIQAGSYIQVIPCILPEPQARTQFVGRMAFKVIPCILPEPQARTQFVGRMAFKGSLPLAPGLIRICEPFSKLCRGGTRSTHNLSVCQGYIIQAGGF